MSDTKKTAPGAQQINDTDLDQAQGGMQSLSNIMNNTTLESPVPNLTSYDESGPGIVHRTVDAKVQSADLDGMHIDPVIPGPTK